MNFGSFVRRGLLAGLFAVAGATGALAQDQAPAQPAQPAPTETKHIGDWLVRCFNVKSPSPCDMFELLAEKKSGRRLMSITLAYLPKQDRHAMQINVPLGVSLQKGLVVHTDAVTSPALHYRRCDRGGCYVEGIIDNGFVDSLARNSNGAKIKLVSFDGRAFNLAFSLNGFAEAHNALVELAKAKVGGDSSGSK
jgi:invasion protein IalB